MSLTLVNNNKVVQYNQIGQYIPMEFAYAEIKGSEVIQLHHQVRCRDFLGDTMIWNAGKVPEIEEMYGYTYKGKATTCLILYGVMASENLPKLQDFEKKMGMVPSELTMLDKTTAVIQGDPEWLKTTFHMSFWTFLIRTLLGEKDADEVRELRNVGVFNASSIPQAMQLFKEKIEKIDTSVVWSWKRLPDEKYIFHSYNGFSSLINWPYNYVQKPAGSE